jgi:ParB-like chromosome segregation protein Spo0J
MYYDENNEDFHVTSDHEDLVDRRTRTSIAIDPTQIGSGPDPDAIQIPTSEEQEEFVVFHTLPFNSCVDPVELAARANSIRRQGIEVSILVARPEELRDHFDDAPDYGGTNDVFVERYLVIDGRDRLYAARSLGLTFSEIPFDVLDPPSDDRYPTLGSWLTCRWLRANAGRKRLRKDEALPVLQSMREAGWTYRRITEETSIPRSTLHRWLSGDDDRNNADEEDHPDLVERSLGGKATLPREVDEKLNRASKVTDAYSDALTLWGAWQDIDPSVRRAVDSRLEDGEALADLLTEALRAHLDVPRGTEETSKGHED